MKEGTKALIASCLAFTCWGLFPIYWKLFPGVSGESLFIHRLFWSLLTLIILVPALGKWKDLLAITRDKRRWWLLLSAVLIASNWLMYVVAVTQGHILEASLGYFLNPLINVLVGRLCLGEVLRRTQWPAVILAAVGVVWMGFAAGLSAFPWLALALSITFALYGVIRKLTHVGALEGLTYESSVVFLPFLAWWLLSGGDVVADVTALGGPGLALLSLSGLVTCIPLVLFAYAARRLPLQTLGFTQYLSPSFKFICGWLIFNEHISRAKWQGFMFIWAGLAWYSVEQIIHARSRRRKAPITVGEI